jgi:chorismate dehydratase
LAKLRVSVVEFLNTAPLVWGFTDGPLAGKYDLSFTVPSQCAETLKRGDADVAIIPSIEYQRIPGMVALPDMAIAAKQEVRSLLVVAKRPIQRVKRLALDTSSRSTVALVRILCKEHWKMAPEFVDAAPDPAVMLAQADGALVIGDTALSISLKMEALVAKAPSSQPDDCCSGDLEEMPVPGVETIFVYDVAYEWRQMTGKPSVLAIWTARPDAVTPELVADFQTSKAYGLAHVREIAEAASIKLDLPPLALERYLTDNINFDLDAENLGGLELYYKHAAALRLIPQARSLEFAAVGASSEAMNPMAGRAKR